MRSFCISFFISTNIESFIYSAEIKDLKASASMAYHQPCSMLEDGTTSTTQKKIKKKTSALKPRDLTAVIREEFHWSVLCSQKYPNKSSFLKEIIILLFAISIFK